MSDKDKGSNYHNKGQQDASKGKYDLPFSGPPIIDELMPKSDKEIQARKEYNEGWRNTKNQKSK